MLLAHKIELRPTPDPAEYLARACGCRRHCYNQLLAHFSQDGVKWSKSAAYQHYMKTVRPLFPWYSDVSSRVTRNAIDDLDNAFKHFFRRVKNGEKPGYPVFKHKGDGDSFALRESEKFSVDGRTLKIEKLAAPIDMRQKLRFTGPTKQVTISQRAGKFYAAILVDTEDYDPCSPEKDATGMDFGVHALAVLSDGTEYPANQKLKANLERLARKQRRLARKQPGSNRRAKAKLSVAKLHKRVSNQRQAVLHELSDAVTSEYQLVCLEDLNVAGMTKNHNLARAINDAGFGTLRRMIEYKADLRGGQVAVIGRFEPSTRLCSQCGQLHDMPLGKEWMDCDCGNLMTRDHNAAINILNFGLDTLTPDLKRAQETCKTVTDHGTVDDGAKTDKPRLSGFA